MKISEVGTAPMCPECNVALEFKNRVYSKEQIDEQGKYYKKMVKMKLFRYFHIGIAFHQSKEAMEMRCPKCQKLYHVENEK